ETTRLAVQLAAGLAHAHASGVVHGALTPDRIFLGGDDVARICAFGLARVLTPAGNQAQDVHDLGLVLRQVGGDRLPPGLAAIVDATAAEPSARPSIFDVLHELHTLTGPPDVWLAPADASGWSAPAAHLDVTDADPASATMPPATALEGAVATSAS
ncbi:MAG TPA: protein kinase, partial [Acidimicrobiia bacterium]|nr:protein kinase [Acidimicrobiia bacterium]